MKYEAVIGLEVHVQIKTKSKMFTRVAAGYGQPANTLTDPVVLALPGVLPVMNKAALDAIIKAGLLLGCDIAPICKWDRKNYFYPDSPKNYQISQFDQPICLNGSVEIELPGAARNIQGERKSIALTRIHLEEDVGKLNHEAFDSLVDYNRAGTPLMEIVSEPVIKSAEEAYAYLTSLRATMIYGGISDCDMEKGQLRCDANISIRPIGETKLGTKVELKNLNSISYVRDGIAHEIQRQLAVTQSGGTIVQETRDYDGQAGTSQSLRSKEMAHDYRYFPDPDLMPVKVDAAWKARIQAECPELPFAKQTRFQTEYSLPYTLTSVLVWDKALADYFEEAAKFAGPGKAQAVGNWVVNEIQRIISNRSTWPILRNALSLPEYDGEKANENPWDYISKVVSAKHLAELVQLIDSGTLLSNVAKEVFAEMSSTGQSPATIVAKKGLAAAPTDSAELEGWCREAIAANAKSVAEFKAGKESAINGLKGPIMKASKGKANPKLVDETLRRLLASL
ncbi:MAG: Asp-tRNA(Asn)/Glu-tRNA(Gln) amidotransferase subunit GatB [Opitutaceae bacterium]|jgi:aspartyl-tRNA(Asn)/glutamyl-tRNA(Gln) amidotransferase subunit B